MHYWTPLVGAMFYCISASAGATMPPCEPQPDRHVVPIVRSEPGPTDWFTRLQNSAQPRFDERMEVYGNRAYRQTLDNGWEFTLIPQQYGWSVRLFDRPGGLDLSQVTPPLHAAVPNPRDLSGWHFRNADNTGPNTGDVNAPQHLRLFSFATGLAGTGGYKPPPGGRVTDLESDGRGWVYLHDIGLADLRAGERARANYLQFSACLSWPVGEDHFAVAAAQASLTYDDADREMFGGCGLDLNRYRLDAAIAPATLALDIDGDGAHDFLAQAINHDTGARELALCRAGTWLHRLSELDATDDLPGGFRSLERWSSVPATHAVAGEPGGETTWPEADGDVIVLQRIEKSMHLIFMHQGVLQSRRVFRFVEP